MLTELTTAHPKRHMGSEVEIEDEVEVGTWEWNYRALLNDDGGGTFAERNTMDAAARISGRYVENNYLRET